MINIQTKDNAVTATIGGQYPVGDWNYTFRFPAHSKDYATLLANNLREHMEHALRKIREDAYNEGWKHAKAKTTKRTWFSCRW